MNADEFVALCERMSPDAQLARLPVHEYGDSLDYAVILTPIGVERLGELLADVESLLNH